MQKARKWKQMDWKHIMLFAANMVTIALIIAIGLMYITPTYRNMVARDIAPLAYRQCQMDTAQIVVNDLNTKGFTQLTLGDKVIKLGQVS